MGLGLPSLSRTFCNSKARWFKASHLLQYSCVVWVWPWFFPAVSSSIPLLWLLYNFGLGYSFACESTVERRHVRCYDCVYHFIYGCSVPYTESCLSVFYKMFIYYPQLTKPFCIPSGISNLHATFFLCSVLFLDLLTFPRLPSKITLEFPAASLWCQIRSFLSWVIGSCW